MKTSSNNLSRCLTRANVRIKVERELATRSLREFVYQAWSIVEPSRVFIPGPHIDAIIDHLEGVSHGHIRRLLINVPPRHMKSLLVSVFWPAWEWTLHPERRAVQQLWSAVEHPRFDQVPAPDRITLVVEAPYQVDEQIQSWDCS